jgi:3-octaprenyl-4-hydroxybenzoate carboxy-lyase
MARPPRPRRGSRLDQRPLDDAAWCGRILGGGKDASWTLAGLRLLCRFNPIQQHIAPLRRGFFCRWGNHPTKPTAPSSGAQSAEPFCRRIGEVAILPKIIVLPDSIDPTNTLELVWAFATRCHPTLSNIMLEHKPAPPLIA